MRLLFDENLSPALTNLLGGQYAGSIHVRSVGLRGGDDFEIRTYAAANGFIIVTKDDDFERMATLFGDPPKVVWLRLGNCTTEQVRSLLVIHAPLIAEFCTDESSAILALP